MKCVFHFSDPTGKKLDFSEDIEIEEVDEDLYEFLETASEVLNNFNFVVSKIEILDTEEEAEEEEEAEANEG